MHHEEYCDLLEVEIGRFVDFAVEAPPQARVPTCPDWDVAELLRHVGTLHRWSAHHVEHHAPARVSATELALDVPDDDTDLPAWLAEGGARALEVFRRCDPDAPVWGWGADRHARFWPRRMIFETLVHRVDGELALDGEPAVDARVAVDGVDELLVNLPHAAYFAPGVGELRGDGEVVDLVAADVDAFWSIRLLPAGFAWEWKRAESPDAVLSAGAGDLLLAMYGRRPLGDASRFQCEGNTALLERFIANASL